MKHPTARKILPDRHIYCSRQMPPSAGFPVLCDLDQARIGCEKQHGDIMPGIYRAPEVILDMEWNEKVDIWAVGMTVSYSPFLDQVYLCFFFSTSPPKSVLQVTKLVNQKLQSVLIPAHYLGMGPLRRQPDVLCASKRPPQQRRTPRRNGLLTRSSPC